MNVNILKTNNPYANIEQLNRTKAKAHIKTPSNNTTGPNAQGQALAAITKNEINYFKNLFPANATQIDNYVSFNRKGNIAPSSASKGTIIDIKG